MTQTSNTIKQISLAGVLSALGIILGLTGMITILGANIYLCGIVIFLTPFILKLPYAIISSSIIIVFSDLITDWIAWTWISLLAYLIPVLIVGLLFISKEFKGFVFKYSFTYFGILMISGLYATVMFFEMTSLAFDNSYAWSLLMGNIVQYTIVAIATYLVFIGLKKSNLGIM